MRFPPSSCCTLLALLLSACFGKTAEDEASPKESKVRPPSPRMLWSNQWGTEGSDDLWSLASGPDGHIIAGGRSDGAITGIPGAGSFDTFVAKLDGATGERLWVVSSGTSEWDDSPALTLDAVGDVYSVGFTQGDLHRENVSFVESFAEKRLSSTGALVWGVQFSGSPATRAYSAVTTPDECLFVVGTHDEQDPNGSNTVRLFLRKLSTTSGETLWEVEWGESDAQTYPNSVRLLGSDTLLIAGRTTGQAHPSGSAKLFALSLSAEDGSVVDSYWLDEGTHNLDAAATTSPQGEAFIAGELDHDDSPDPLAPVQFVSALGWSDAAPWQREFTQNDFDYVTSLSYSEADPAWLGVAGSAPQREPGNPHAHSSFALMLLDPHTGATAWSYRPEVGPDSRARALTSIRNKAWSVGGDTEGSLYGPHLGASDIFVAHFYLDGE